jgi:GT2 family glycosyltransferase
VLVAAVLVLATRAGHAAAVGAVAVASGAALVVGAAAAVPPLVRARRGAPVPPGAFRFGFIQGVAGVLVQLVHRGGVAAVALLAASSRQTGFAGLAIGLALAATYAVWQAFALQLPRLAVGAAADPGGAEAAAERLAWTSLLVVGPVAVAGAAVLEPALPLLAGERFRGAEAALVPALALVPLAPLTALLTQSTALRLRPDVRLRASAVGAAVFVVAAGAAVPPLGAAGATTALLAATLGGALASVVLLPGSASRRVIAGAVGAAAAALAVGLASRGTVSVSALAQVAALAVAAALAILALRRLVLLVAALLPAPRPAAPATGSFPSVTLLVAAHDEADCVERLLAAIERLDYPRDRLAVVLVDDGSGDGTGDIFTRWAAQQPHATAVRLAVRSGKPAALNHAMRVGPASDLVGVCDADHEPRPDSLQRVVAALADETVGAAGAFLRPVNANESLVARYAAVEAWVTQLVTSTARSRLDLNPPMLGGGSVYRRPALDDIGGFPDAFTTEDVGAAIALTRRGWRTRFVRDAIVDNHVVADCRQYWSQHVRWARSSYETARLQGGGSAPLGRRIEAWMVSAGYLDRIALVAAAGFAAAGLLPLWVPAGYLGVVGLAVLLGLARGGAIRRLPLYVVAMVVMLLVDAAATLVASGLHVRRRPLRWSSPRAATRQQQA